MADIGDPQHERNMQVPPLPVIQAATLLCHILAVSKNPTAYNMAAVHRGCLVSVRRDPLQRTSGPS